MSSEDLTSDEESFEPLFVPFKNSRGLGSNRKKFVDNAPIEQQEFGKFEEYTKGIGSKLLMKMGYKPGQGLGSDGSGIVEPIDVKLRPQKMGLGHGGFDERTNAVKKEMEDKMDIDEEEYIPLSRSKISKTAKKAVVYKTAEEIIKEQGRVKIIDMTGKEAREMESFTEELRHSELPELRYNLKVLGDTYKSRLEAEARALAVEKESIKKLQQDIEKKIDQVSKADDMMDIHTHLFQTLTSIQSNFDLVSCKTLISWDDLELHYSKDFSDLEHLYYDQVKSMHLEELVVGALAPFFKSILNSWNVLQEPSLGTSVLKRWIRLLDISDTLLQYNKKQKTMTFYESLLYNVWLPKVRNSVQNELDPRVPEPLILLLESWNDLIPRWLHHIIYEQLVAPKLKAEIENWNHKKESSSLQGWLFPWLPIAAEKLESLGVWEQARLKIGSCLLDWKPDEDWALKMLIPWKEVFSDAELLPLVNRNICPKLSNMLKTDFNINPASQDLKPLEIILEWYHAELISPLGICNLLSQELFPKWHGVLWTWLGTAGASLADICEWYLAWKALFPPIVVDQLTRQFRFALDLMNLAMNSPDSLSKSIPPMRTSSSQIPQDHQEPVVPSRLTFFEYIDLACSRSGIEFLPLVGKVHSETGKPLYKMSGVSGKSTILYIDHGVLYSLSESGHWHPLAVTEAISSLS